MTHVLVGPRAAPLPTSPLARLPTSPSTRTASASQFASPQSGPCVARLSGRIQLRVSAPAAGASQLLHRALWQWLTGSRYVVHAASAAMRIPTQCYCGKRASARCRAASCSIAASCAAAAASSRASCAALARSTRAWFTRAAATTRRASPTRDEFDNDPKSGLLGGGAAHRDASSPSRSCYQICIAVLKHTAILPPLAAVLIVHGRLQV